MSHILLGKKYKWPIYKNTTVTNYHKLFKNYIEMLKCNDENRVNKTTMVCNGQFCNGIAK